jgi:hypothetical protein
MTITIADQTLFNKLTYSQFPRFTRSQIEAASQDAADMFDFLEYYWDYHWAQNPGRFFNLPMTRNGSGVGGTNVVTGLSATSDLAVGMSTRLSPNIDDLVKVSAINSSTSITLAPTYNPSAILTSFTNQPIRFGDQDVTLRSYYDPAFYTLAIHLTMGGEAAFSEARALQGMEAGKVWAKELIDGGGSINPWNFANCRGTALLYAVTGDPIYRGLLRSQADYMIGSASSLTPRHYDNGYWYENLMNVPAFPLKFADRTNPLYNDAGELREMHRLGEVLLYCWLTGATSNLGVNYGTLVDLWLEKALARQHPDGSFRDHSVMPYLGGDINLATSYNLDSHTWGVRTFYMGFYCFTLCEYYILRSPDPRIITAVEAAMNYIYNDPDNYVLYKAAVTPAYDYSLAPVFPSINGEYGLAYISFSGGQEGSYEPRSPADAVGNTLNDYQLLNHAFLWKYTGNTIWKTRFWNLVRGQRWAYFPGQSQGMAKQLNQQYAYWPLAVHMIMGDPANVSNPHKIRGKWRNA